MTRIGLTILSVACLAASTAVAHEAARDTGASAAKGTGKLVLVDIREADGKMLFAPDRLDVAKGETIRFVVHNAGALPHEFVIGTKAANAEHAKMMAEMPGMEHHDSNAISLKPGATKALTWRFAKPGSFEFACLLPGHYEAGMHGEVLVR